MVARCTTTQAASTTAESRCASQSRTSGRVRAAAGARAGPPGACGPGRRSQLAFQGCHGDEALQSGDRARRVQRLGAICLAALVAVAGVAPRIPRDGGEALAASVIAHVVDERPGAVERR